MSTQDSPITPKRWYRLFFIARTYGFEYDCGQSTRKFSTDEEALEAFRSFADDFRRTNERQYSSIIFFIREGDREVGRL